MRDAGRHALSKDDSPATADLVALARDRSAPVDRFLEAARELLDVEVAFVGQFGGGRQLHRHFAGDPTSFGLTEGGSLALAETVCHRVVEGAAPAVIPDTSVQEGVRELQVVREGGIGCYVGIPLRFSDGRLYGMFCCLGRERRPTLGERDVAFMHVLARMVADQIERDELSAANQRLQTTAAAVSALLSALEARDGYTGEHSQAVVRLSSRVARRLGLPEDEVAAVEQVALLHDIGKLGVPDAILRKPGPLDDAEWALMAEHPVIGARIVSSLESVAHLAPAIRAEHERWDGSGYPDGLAGEAIPIASRITLACDAYHAMISDRPYRRGRAHELAVHELEHGRGAQFCPSTTDALLAVLAGAAGEKAA